ncbi:PREDICTED: photosystem I chlorophyll a/b-binding protein 5, chloroplastic isoform X2 [Camelina sativa]|uniref:Chlorophyll a-b binding protein, chloroplastic n=1 Tax=Camelina sativa TaxID=90675 RepID=A0ABM1QVX1_CAMSA|nr:PREDICTED: photosystem I chlorophyll a/b-binding protein 5, chloroplastic isoform X2 [Camelina sativa]
MESEFLVVSICTKALDLDHLFVFLKIKVSWRLWFRPTRVRRGSGKLQMVCSSRACSLSFRHARCCRNTLHRWIRDLPVWYKAGAVKFDFASTKTLIFVQFLLMGFAETKRYMDFVSPGSQAKEESFFFGIEAALEGLEPGYPGGPLLNPLGLAKDIKNAHDWKLKEIKNGRLAMMVMLGFFVQASVTHTGPIDNLVEHLSNPWHKTIIQTLFTSAS